MLFFKFISLFRPSNFLFLLVLPLSAPSFAQTIQNEGNEIECKSSGIDQEYLLNSFKGLANSLNQGIAEATKERVLSAASSEVSSRGSCFLQKYFPTVELDIALRDGNKPTGGLLILSPIFSQSPKNTLFTQGSLFRKDDRTTVNIGFGYRRLEYDNKLLLGINTFYDHEFPYNHARSSLGIEARTSVGEFNANLYKGLTGWKAAKNSINEKGLGGHDLEFGMPFPYVNWAKLYVKEFKWKSAVEGEKDVSGRDLSVNISVPSVPGLSLEAGHRDYKSQSDENFVKVSYNLTLGLKTKKNKRSWVNKSAYQLVSMEDRRFDKVRRENLIYKQRKSSGTLLVGGY